MSGDDQSDFARFKKILDRFGKAEMMSAETETSETHPSRSLSGVCP